MGDYGIEDIGAFGLSLGGKGAALPAAERDDARSLWVFERIEPDHLAARQRLLPLGLAQEHALRRYGMVRRRAERLALKRLRARIVMVGDLLEPSGTRIVDQRVQRDDGARQIVEQGSEAVVEE